MGIMGNNFKEVVIIDPFLKVLGVASLRKLVSHSGVQVYIAIRKWAIILFSTNLLI